MGGMKTCERDVCRDAYRDRMRDRNTARDRATLECLLQRNKRFSKSRLTDDSSVLLLAAIDSFSCVCPLAPIWIFDAS